MFTSKPRGINGLFLLVGLVGLLFGSAGPAAAMHLEGSAVGSGGRGYELGPNLTALCSDINNQFTGAHFTATYYIITHTTSTYTVADSDMGTAARYVGPASMDIQHKDMVAGPQGSRPGSCVNETPFVAAPIDLTSATVKGTGSSSGSVNCSGTNNGTYYRVLDKITIDFEVTCTVVGNGDFPYNGTVSDVRLIHQVTGTQKICSDAGGCANANAGSLLTTQFTADAAIDTTH